MTGLDAALAAVREALLARARAEADHVRERAGADARQEVAGARAEADRIRRSARAEGTAGAATANAIARGQAARQARALVLAERREAYERLRRAAREAVARIGTEPGVREQLVLAVRAALGPDARIVDTPDGGVRGVTGDRRLDLSLTGFADRAVDAVLGQEPEAVGASGTEEQR
ncbi:hypothetical protein ACN27G_09880 [Plantactinospora sp. WMMB334]|uniref:hypothetical protein n=1 Tax=Plantactinospora sp. WMMB334 TaxID=3404119 RepID=UPI003B92D322